MMKNEKSLERESNKEIEKISPSRARYRWRRNDRMMKPLYRTRRLAVLNLAERGLLGCKSRPIGVVVTEGVVEQEWARGGTRVRGKAREGTAKKAEGGCRRGCRRGRRVPATWQVLFFVPSLPLSRLILFFSCSKVNGGYPSFSPPISRSCSS